MNSWADIYRHGLSPLRGLFLRRTEPTAHAVGYSLTALRACRAAIPVARKSTGVCSSWSLHRRNPAPVAAEQRQRVAQGGSRGWASQTRKPRRGESNYAQSSGEWRFASQTIVYCALVFVVVGCGDAKVGAELKQREPPGGSANDITTRVFERDRDKDGKPEFRMETVFRAGQKVMLVTSKPNAQGVLSVSTRSFLVKGKLVSTEADEDGDGFFESIMVSHLESGGIEVFVRHRDGSVQPASTSTVEAYRKQMSAVSEFFEEMQDKNATPTNLDDQIIEERIRATQKKIQDAEKEKDK